MIREYYECAAEKNRVMQIWLKAAIKAHPFIPASYWMDRFDTVKTKYLPRAKTFVYEQNERIDGFVSVLGGGIVGALFVDICCQKRGVGKALLNHVKGMYARLELAVYVENRKAVAFYKSQGFATRREQTNADTGHMEYVVEWRHGMMEDE